MTKERIIQVKNCFCREQEEGILVRLDRGATRCFRFAGCCGAGERFNEDRGNGALEKGLQTWGGQKKGSIKGGVGA